MTDKQEEKLQTLYFSDGTLFLLNQLKLPGKVEYLACPTAARVASAIRKMVVRGAPAIGVSAAYGMAIAASSSRAKTTAAFARQMEKASRMLYETRPTAVNLGWALERMKNIYSGEGSPAGMAAMMMKEAEFIHEEDVRLCHAIGDYGNTLIKDGDGILTHCNAGALATAGWGTALGVIRSAHCSGKKIRVYIDETRPYLQGARITALEMMDAGTDCCLICDNMAGWLMACGKITKVVVGADRIAANGDTANKIGTYSLAVLSSHHGIPFYIAAPYSTFDLSIKDGKSIPIEERDASEVTGFRGVRTAPEGISVRNPAFDVTPNGLITAIISDRGIISPPFSKNIRKISG